MRKVFALLLLLAVQVIARPSSFASQEVTPDADGYIRYEGTVSSTSKRESRSAPYVKYTAKFNEGVISVDSDVPQIDSIKCDAPHFTFTLLPGESAPIWPERTVIFAGAEWECIQSNNVFTGFGIVVENQTEIEGGFQVYGELATPEDIFSYFTLFASQNTTTEKRAVESGYLEGDFNYNKSTGKANNEYTLYQSDCSSSSLSPEASEFCQNGGVLSNVVKCTNCYSRIRIEWTLQYSLLANAQFTVKGYTDTNIEVKLDGNSFGSQYSKETGNEDLSIASIGFAWFFSAGFYLNSKLGVDHQWKAQGQATVGVKLSGEFGLSMGNLDTYRSPYFDTTQYERSLSDVQVNGESTTKLKLTVGPSFNVVVAGKVLVKVGIYAEPYVNLGLKVGVPPLPAIASTPTPNPFIPTSSQVLQVCQSNHLLEYTVSVGFDGYFAKEGSLVSKEQLPLVNLNLNLISGCMGAASGSSLTDVKLYFPFNSTAARLSIKALSQLLVQDLTKMLETSIVSLGDIAREIKEYDGESLIEVKISFVQSEYTPSASSAALRLSNISQKPESIQGNNYYLANQMVNAPAQIVAQSSSDAQNNQLQSFAHSVVPSVLFVVIFAFASFF